MTSPTKLETMTIDELTDEVGSVFTHWGYYDLTTYRRGSAPVHRRNLHCCGSRPTVAGLLFEASMLMLRDPMTYGPMRLCYHAGDTYQVSDPANAALTELLKRANHALFVGIPHKPALRRRPMPRILAWTGDLLTAVGLAQLGVTHIHQMLCPMVQYMASLDLARDETVGDDGEDKSG